MGSQKWMEGKTTNIYSLRKKIEKPKLLKAKDMFKNLGWYLDIETNDKQIVYSKNIYNNDTLGFIGAKTIIFDNEFESVYLDEFNDISMLLLEAINQQVKELNWDNDTN